MSVCQAFGHTHTNLSSQTRLAYYPLSPVNAAWKEGQSCTHLKIIAQVDIRNKHMPYDLSTARPIT